MKWWKKLYGTDDYLLIFAPYITIEHTMSQVDFIVKNLPLRHDSQILDLCCGTGRHAIELANRGYYNVVGFDWSDKYLAIARTSAVMQGVSVKFVQGDMRSIGYDSQFDFVLNIFTSFGYFEEDSENERVIEQISKALKPGGWFFFDTINPVSLICFPLPVIWHYNSEADAIIVRERFLDLFAWRLKEKCMIFDKQGNREYAISYRLYTLAEFTNLLKRYGLKFLYAFGDFDGRDCCEEIPPRMIVVSQKEQ